MRTKLLSRVIVFVLVLSLAVPAVCFADGGTATGDIGTLDMADAATIDREEISAQDWMYYLPDNAPVLEVNLPGTHNTACRYFYDVPFTYKGLTISTGLISSFGKTQDLSIPQQLEAGTRFLDCRIALVESISKDHLVVPHNMLITADKKDNGDPMLVETLIAHAEAFVKAHPSETIVIAADRDGRTYDKTSARFLELEQALYDSFRNNPGRVLLEEKSPSPRMKDLRGKVVLIDADLFYAFGGESAKKAEDKWREVKALLDVAPDQNYVDEVRVMKSQDQFAARPIDMNTSSRGEIRDNGDKIGLGIPYPDRNAKVMNEYLMNYDFREGKFYGWFLMDYVTEALNRKVFLTNTLDPKKLGIETDDPEEKMIAEVKEATIGKLNLKSANKKIVLTWTNGKGVTPEKYYIYRSVKKAGDFRKIATVTSKKYTDSKSLKKGKKYYYKVRGAVKVSGKTYKTKASAVKTIKCK